MENSANVRLYNAYNHVDEDVNVHSVGAVISIAWVFFVEKRDKLQILICLFFKFGSSYQFAAWQSQNMVKLFLDVQYYGIPLYLWSHDLWGWHTYLPSSRSIRGLSTISLSCCIVVRWLGCDSDTWPVPFTLDSKAPNSCILCWIWGSRDLAKMLLSSSSTPFSFCCSSFRILAASSSSWVEQVIQEHSWK